MNYQTLKTEIDIDPLGRGYSSMNDEEVATDLNTEYRNRNRTSLSGDDVFSATDAAEFAALDQGAGNDADIKNLWLAFCARDSIDPFGAANVAFVQWIFGGGSTTISNLQALRVEPQSRASELGLGAVKTGDVEYARRI